MRLEETKRPAMTLTEAAMLPAQLKTLAGHAVLSAVERARDKRTEPVDMKTENQSTPAAAQIPLKQGISLRRAAFCQIRRF